MDATVRAPAPHRIGEPSPLLFHLAAALTVYVQALMAAPRARSEQFPWSDDLSDRARLLPPDLDQLEIAREIAARLRAMLDGLETWQAHPYRRQVEDPPVIWSAGCTRLLDYGLAPEAANPHGPPVLVVPSLINRAYILDLAPGRSLLRWLASEGLRPVLLDWGIPTEAEAALDLDGYGGSRLLPALDYLTTESGRLPAVMGYCMGGTLAAGLAARAPTAIRRIVTIGAPWDFASPLGIAGGLRAMIRSQGAERAERMLAGLGDAFGLLPVAVFQMLFALVNPIQAALKFQRLERMDPDSSAARLFVALEDWLADGIPMPVPAARDLLVSWQIGNDTARRRWRFLGGEVDPAAIRVPALCFTGQRDTIAPPPLSEPLAAAIPGARLIQPRTGHVGMVIGGHARGAVMRPMADFLLGRPG